MTALTLAHSAAPDFRAMTDKRLLAYGLGLMFFVILAHAALTNLCVKDTYSFDHTKSHPRNPFARTTPQDPSNRLSIGVESA